MTPVYLRVMLSIPIGLAVGPTETLIKYRDLRPHPAVHDPALPTVLSIPHLLTVSECADTCRVLSAVLWDKFLSFL